jgi:hypothetical protein
MITINGFNLRIEQLKVDHQFDTYIETLGYFLENETDHEPEKIVKFLNKKITEEIYKEANSSGMLKTQEEVITLL